MPYIVTYATIKIDSTARDRLNELAARHGCGAGSMVEKLLDEHLWQRQVDLAVRQMSSMSVQDREQYRAEVDLWDSASGDGLEQWQASSGPAASSGSTWVPPWARAVRSEASSRGFIPLAPGRSRHARHRGALH